MSTILASRATVSLQSVVSSEELGELWIHVRSDVLLNAGDFPLVEFMLVDEADGYTSEGCAFYSDYAGAWDDEADQEQGYEAWWILRKANDR